ncbi:MAG TPA: HWE histidine kinase domain-containing protein [Caulobacteraceae bacterium]
MPDPIRQLDQTVLDALPIGVYVCDADGLIVRVNLKAIELWGRTPRLHDAAQRFCGCFRVESLEGAYIPPAATPMAAAVREGVSFEGVEAWVENPDGRRWVASVTIHPLTGDGGEIVGAINCFHDVTADYERRRAMERQQRSFDLAMVASKMGTWRYTMDDNVCVYDDNAQRLYGLTEAHFLHDAEGVKAKFHPDDMELMWSRVTQACDPAGDGVYEVEYRVRQLDGRWRWLSAWGLVEFEGLGDQRRPVAISGASRDLTERKDAEDIQRLMVNELNHRVKNSLATVQSIAMQTLRGAADPEAARQALDQRICSLARAHDLLTARNWSGAALHDVVARAVQPFLASSFAIGGPPIEVSPRQALALSIALHELATNAAKYGALTTPQGLVDIAWRLDGQEMVLTWRESGGPAVSPPTRRGFGSRLLERGLLAELGGRARVDYDPGGVVCEFRAPLET